MKIKPLVRMFTAGISRLGKQRTGKLPAPSPALSVERARREWELALQDFNQAEGDLIDNAILKLNTAEKKYNALLKQMKKNGTSAWSID